jgi:hypothetical protein
MVNSFVIIPGSEKQWEAIEKRAYYEETEIFIG